MRAANVCEDLRAYRDEVRDNLFVWKLDQHLERLFVNMKIMRMTSPCGFDEHRQAVLDRARAKRFREDVHMRLVTHFGFGGAGDVRKYRPEEIEIGAWAAGAPAPTTTPSGAAFTSASAVGGASTTIRFRPG